GADPGGRVRRGDAELQPVAQGRAVSAEAAVGGFEKSARVGDRLMEVVGVDGTKGGWVAIALDSGRFTDDHLLQPIETSFSDFAGAQIIAVDIPVGFGPRMADAAARAFLAGAASTVFTTPPRGLLEMPFGPGLGLSAQSHALG